MIIGITRELVAGENRVSLCPDNVQSLVDKGLELWVEQNAGAQAGFSDDDYISVGAKVVSDRDELFAKSDVILQVQSFGSNTENADDDLKRLKAKQLVIGMMDPLAQPQAAQQVAGTGATAIALEMVPRISRAQSMDVLSSMATLAGYRSV